MGEEINFGLGLGFAESKTTGLGLGFGKVHYPAKYSAESRTRYTPKGRVFITCNLVELHRYTPY